MQAYGPGFAKVYNMRFGDFARAAAPRIRAYYETTIVGQDGNRTLLDICCGTGHLSLHFLTNGYQVIGIDLSPSMLEYARQNAASYVETRQARFFEGDAVQFGVDRPIGLAVASCDSMNHLEDMSALAGCFRCVYQAVVSGGSFIFDLNTGQGLRRSAVLNIQENEELTMLTGGVYDEQQDRAYNRTFGFLRLDNGKYERFEETIYNTSFDLMAVRASLSDAGWKVVRFCRITDLNVPLDEPEKENRIWVVAMKI